MCVNCLSSVNNVRSFRLLTDGDTGEWEAVDEVHGAVHGVDDPGGRVGEVHLLTGRHRLLADVPAGVWCRVSKGCCRSRSAGRGL